MICTTTTKATMCGSTDEAKVWFIREQTTVILKQAEIDGIYCEAIFEFAMVSQRVDHQTLQWFTDRTETRGVHRFDHVRVRYVESNWELYKMTPRVYFTPSVLFVFNQFNVA